MILPAAARHGRGRRLHDRYAAWRGALEELRELWGAGRAPAVHRLAELLEAVPAEQRPEALEDLLAEHLHLSWRQGRGSLVEEFAGLAAEAPADLVEEEFLARYQRPFGDAPALEEYLERFPGRLDVADRLGARFLAGGRYVKVERLGGGGAGQVWEAWDHLLGRSVAIKEPRAAETEAREHLAREARITARLEHPAILGLHDFHPGGADGRPFLVTRLVEGRTLGEWIADHHRGTGAGRRRLLRTFLAVCEAVAYAHSKGVLHCDLKPGNVVVGDFGETVVLDWGLAACPDEGVEVNCVRGTPEYMAPEQVEGGCSAACDVFGLGAILHEVLTGHPPHAWPLGVRPSHWREAVREFRGPGDLETGGRSGLADLCRKALAPSPARRFETVQALVEEMEGHLEGTPRDVGGGWLRRLVGRGRPSPST